MPGLLERADDSSLDQRPVVLNRLRVNVATHVFHVVVDHLVSRVGPQELVSLVAVRDKP